MKILISLLFMLLASQVEAQVYLESLTSIEDFKRLESNPLSEKYSNVASVKVIYDLRSDRIFFIDSKKYKFHYDFCTSVLGFDQDLSYFNGYNYSDSQYRQFYLATINHYRDANMFTFEFSTSEVLSYKNLEFFNRVWESALFANPLYLFPTGAEQLSYVESLEAPINYVTADQIYGSLQYQALNQTYAYGRLKKVDIDNFKKSDIDQNDIVVINGTPLEMPICRGIITTDFQPPLSHLVILSHNRGTPIMALKRAWDDQKIDSLNGKLVRFAVDNDYYQLTPVLLDEAEKYWKKTSHKKLQVLEIDTVSRGIQSISSLGMDDVIKVGGKAANYGELNKIYLRDHQKLAIPKAGFAIPFYYYHEHITNHHIDSLIQVVLDSDRIRNDEVVLAKKLKEIRKAIKKGKVNRWLISDMEDLSRKNGYYRLRFRSSTNAEDIKGFNGAGLYDSKTGILDDEKKTFEKAIRKVWASLWNLRAFQEREFFHIDHRSVAMGILVHQSFPDEEVNGVAITKNIYRPARTGFVVNAQMGEVSIVLPPSGVSSEQFIIKHNLGAKGNVEVDYISFSSIHDNKPLLTHEEIEELSAILAAIKKHFYRQLPKFSRPSFTDFAMDVEFKLEADTRRIIVKQARIY